MFPHSCVPSCESVKRPLPPPPASYSTSPLLTCSGHYLTHARQRQNSAAEGKKKFEASIMNECRSCRVLSRITFILHARHHALECACERSQESICRKLPWPDICRSSNAEPEMEYRIKKSQLSPFFLDRWRYWTREKTKGR